MHTRKLMFLKKLSQPSMLLTTEEISEILHMDKTKTANVITILLKQEYLEKTENKYKFTEKGRDFLERMYTSKQI